MDETAQILTVRLTPLPWWIGPQGVVRCMDFATIHKDTLGRILVQANPGPSGARVGHGEGAAPAGAVEGAAEAEKCQGWGPPFRTLGPPLPHENHEKGGGGGRKAAQWRPGFPN